MSTLYIIIYYIPQLHYIRSSTDHYYKVRTFIEPGPRANNFVRPPPASAASIYLRTHVAGRMAERFIRAAERSLVSRSESGRVAGACSLSRVRTMSYRRLYRRDAARRSVTRRRDGNTRLSRAFLPACLHTRIHIRTHSVVSFLAVARYLIFTSSPLCRRGKSSSVDSRVSYRVPSVANRPTFNFSTF